MHLVFVTSIVPDGTLTSGYEIANAAIVEGLRRAGARVSIIGFTWPGKQPLDPQQTLVLGELNVQTETSSATQKVKWLARALIDGQTFASAKLRGPGEDAMRAALAKLEPYDAYVLNGAQLAGAYPDLFKDRPSIFIAHNVEHVSARENAEAAHSLLQRLLYRREARLLESMEEKLCRDAGFIFTLAQEDRAALGVNHDDRSAMLPLTTRPARPASNQTKQYRCDAALIGTWTWTPNRIGLEWFLRKVVPHLPESLSIHIAGSMPSGIESKHRGVRFLGRVEDATEFIRSARIVPLISRAGTGVQLKTIETFELGLPSVATSLSLRGIDHVPDNCRVTDDPVEFARAIIDAAEQPADEVDGALFHAAQHRAMDRQIMLGLEAIKSRPDWRSA